MMFYADIAVFTIPWRCPIKVCKPFSFIFLFEKQ